MLATLSATLLACCRSPTVERAYLPELSFPPFPPIETAESGVTVSEDWVIRLAEFRIRLEELEADYADMKGLAETEK